MKTFLRIVAFIALAYILDNGIWYLIGKQFEPAPSSPSTPDLGAAILESTMGFLDFILTYGPIISAAIIFVCALIAFGLTKAGLIVGLIFGGLRFAALQFGVMALKEDPNFRTELLSEIVEESRPAPEMQPAPSRLAPPPVPVPAGTPQQRAIQLYPDLGKSNSPLNQEFLRRYKAYQSSRKAYFSDPEWPTKLAAESYQALKK